MPHLTKDSWAVLGLLAGMIAAGVAFVYMPQSGKLEDLRSGIASAKTALETHAQNVSVVPDMLKQVQNMKVRYKDFDRKLPKRKELGGFLREVSSNLADERLANQLIEPGSPTREELFNTLPIIMKFRGSYLSLASFLKRIDEMQRLSRIQKVKIETNPKDDSALDIELQMNIYFTES